MSGEGEASEEEDESGEYVDELLPQPAFQLEHDNSLTLAEQQAIDYIKAVQA